MPKVFALFIVISMASLFAAADTATDAQETDALNCRPPKPFLTIERGVIKPVTQIMCAMKPPLDEKPPAPAIDDNAKPQVSNDLDVVFDNGEAPAKPEITEEQDMPRKKVQLPTPLKMPCPMCIRAPCPCPHAPKS